MREIVDIKQSNNITRGSKQKLSYKLHFTLSTSFGILDRTS